MTGEVNHGILAEHGCNSDPNCSPRPKFIANKMPQCPLCGCWGCAAAGAFRWLVASKILGVVISTVCTWNSFLKFRAILGKEGSLLIINQFSSYIPPGINLNRQGYERDGGNLRPAMIRMITDQGIRPSITLAASASPSTMP